MRKLTAALGLAGAVLTGVPQRQDASDAVFTDDFEAALSGGWIWVREVPGAWRVTKDGLEIRVQPGNMWGPANDAKNVLVRPVPEPANATVEVSVTVSNRPTGQYEQIDLVWYYDDRHMVKIGQEQVDGVLSLVMGREEGDKTRTIAIIPVDALSLDVRFVVSGHRIRGQFRPAGDELWKDAGETTLPSNGRAEGEPPGVSGPARCRAVGAVQSVPYDAALAVMGQSSRRCDGPSAPQLPRGAGGNTMRPR